MDKREALKSMLNNLINDKTAEAELDFHAYATSKMRDVAGLAPEPVAAEVTVDEPVAPENDGETVESPEAPSGNDATQ